MVIAGKSLADRMIHNGAWIGVRVANSRGQGNTYTRGGFHSSAGGPLVTDGDCG